MRAYTSVVNRLGRQGTTKMIRESAEKSPTWLRTLAGDKGAHSLGVVGALAKKTFFGTDEISLKQGVLANMFDGSVANFGAYAFSRDEEYEWAKLMYGSEVGWDQYRFSMMGHMPGPMGFMHSGAGALTMGMVFGGLMGGALRGVGMAFGGARSLKEIREAGGDPPYFLKDPIGTMKNYAKHREALRAGREESLWISGIVSDKRAKVVQQTTEMLQQGFTTAGVSSESAARQAKALANIAWDQGLDSGEFVRAVTMPDGSIDPKVAARELRKRGIGYEAARRRAGRRRHFADPERRVTEKAVSGFHHDRMQKLLDSGEEWTEADHIGMLNDYIARMPEVTPGDKLAKKKLTEFRDNLLLESDEVIHQITAAVASIKGFDDLEPKAKQAMLDNILEHYGLYSKVNDSGLKLSIEDLENIIKTRDVEAEGARIRKRRLAKRTISDRLDSTEGRVDTRTPEARLAKRRAKINAATRRKLEALDLTNEKTPNEVIWGTIKHQPEALTKKGEPRKKRPGRKKLIEIAEKVKARMGVESSTAGKLIPDSRVKPATGAEPKRGAAPADPDDIMARVTESNKGGIGLLVGNIKSSDMSELKKMRLLRELEKALFEGDEEAARAFLVRNFMSEDAEFKSLYTDTLLISDAVVRQARASSGVPETTGVRRLSEADTRKADVEAEARRAEEEAEAKKAEDEAIRLEAEDAVAKSVVSEAIGTGIMNQRLRDNGDANIAYRHEAIPSREILEAEARGEAVKSGAYRETVDTVIMRTLIENDPDVDIEAKTGRVLYNFAVMAERTAARTKRLQKALGTRKAESLDKQADAAFDALPKDGKGKKPKAVTIKKAIREEFGVDMDSTFIKGEVTGGLLLRDGGLEAYYKNLHKMKAAEQLSAKARRRIAQKMLKQQQAEGAKPGDMDTTMLLAAGDLPTAASVAGHHLNIVNGMKNVDASGEVSRAELVAAWPRQQMGMLDTVYAEAFNPATQRFNLQVMRNIAQERLARVDTAYRMKFEEVTARNEEKMSTVAKIINRRINAVENVAARTQAWLGQKSEAVASVNHRAIIDDRIEKFAAERGTSKMSLEQYLNMQEEGFAKGIAAAWRALPLAVKNRVNRQLKNWGVDEYVRTASLWTKEAVENGDAAVQAKHAEFGQVLWRAMRKEVGQDEMDIATQWNGERNSASGFAVGASLIESLANYTKKARTGDFLADLVDAAQRDIDGTSRGHQHNFLGHMSEESLALKYKDYAGESVQRHLMEEQGMLDSDGIARVLKGYDDLAARIKSVGLEGLTEDELARVAHVRYNIDTRKGFSPEKVETDILTSIKTARQRFVERMAMIRALPMGVIDSLHDEAKVMQGAHSAMFGLGTLPGSARTALNPHNHGDAGFNAAAFTPGSWKDFLTLRAGQKFGTIDGLTEAAGLYGLKHLKEYMEGKQIDEVLNELELLDNAADASAQAVTMAQSIARDFTERAREAGVDVGEAKRLAGNTPEFRALLKDIKEMMMEVGGGKRALASLDENVKAYISRFTQEADLYDRYSAAGVKAIDKLKNPGWSFLKEAKSEGRLIKEEAQARADAAEAEGATVAPKIGGNPLADWARDELFKPPVMTVVYAAGGNAFQANTIRALTMLEDMDMGFKFTDKAGMARELAAVMQTKGNRIGVIGETLSIPDSNQMVRMFQGLNPDKNAEEQVVVPALTVNGKNIAVGEFISGEWKGRADKIEVARALEDQAEMYFGVPDVGLGLWLIKLQASKGEDRMMTSLKMMGDAIDEARSRSDGSKKDLLRHLENTWRPVSGFLRNIQTQNRIPHLLNTDVANVHMNMMGVNVDDLSPMARKQFDGVAVFGRGAAGAGRRVGWLDGHKSIRAAEQETTLGESKVGKELKPSEMESHRQMAQYHMDDSHNSVFGRFDEEDVDIRVQNAVLHDLQYEMGAFILPEGMANPSFKDFIHAIYEYNRSETNSHYSRVQRATQLNTNINRLKRDLEDTDPADIEKRDRIIRELAHLENLKKTVYAGRQENAWDDQTFSATYGSGIVAAELKAEAMVSVPGTNRIESMDHASALGIPDLQVTSHALHDSTLKLLRRDGQGDPSLQPFSFREVATDSALDPAYIDAVKAARPDAEARFTSEVDPREAKSRGAERSKESVALENADDANYDHGFGIGATRLGRLQDRIQRISRADRDRIMRLKFDEESNSTIRDPMERLARREQAARRIAKNMILSGFRNTFGRNPEESDGKVNMYKFRKDGVIRGTSNSLFEAVGDYFMDNNHTNHMGWLMGPQSDAGLFIHHVAKHNYDGPSSAAMGPLSVFARDYELMGAGRDFGAVTIIRMADGNVDNIPAVIKRVNEEGFFKVHEEWMMKRYGDKGKVGGFDFDLMAKEAHQYRGFVSDGRLTPEIKKQMDELSDPFLRELGGDEGSIRNMPSISPEGRIEMNGLLEHFERNPKYFEYLRDEVYGISDLTPETLAAGLSMSRQEMLALGKKIADGEKVDVNLLFHPRTEDGEVKQTAVDYVNGMEVVDHNIIPGKRGEIPVFTESQMQHMFNLSANREIAKKMIYANQFGLEFDPRIEIENILSREVSDFANGTAVHGFNSYPTQRDTVTQLQQGTDASVDPLFQYGKMIKENFDLKGIEALEFKHAGLAHLLVTTRLYVDGKMSDEGIAVAKAFNMTDASDLETLTRASDQIFDSFAKADSERDLAQAMTAAERRTELMDEKLQRDHSIDTTHGDEASPFRESYETDDTLDPETHIDTMDMVDSVIREDENVPMFVNMDVRDRRMGDKFTEFLDRRARMDGDAAALNAKKAFEILTGRQKGTEKNALGDGESMAMLELSFVDSTFRAALWGGRMEIEDEGPASVIIGETAQGRLITKLRGLQEVKRKTKNKGIAAGTYLLTHELVERMDGIFINRNTGSRSANSIKGTVSNLFVQNFGTAKGREQWSKIFAELGLLDDKMKNFLKASEELMEGIEPQKVSDWNAARSKISDIDTQARRDTVTEGFTQVLTMAMMAKQGSKLGKLAKKLGSPEYSEAVGAIKSKMLGLKKVVEDFGVVNREADAHVKAGRFLLDDPTDEGKNTLNQIMGNIYTMTSSTKSDRVRRVDGASQFVRSWGGREDAAPAPMPTRSIGDVKAEIDEINARIPTAGPSARMQLELQRNNLREEMRMMTSDPKSIMDQEYYDSIRDSLEDGSGLIDLRNLNNDDAVRTMGKAIDDLLADIETQQSSMFGGAVNIMAGALNGGKGLALNNSKFSVIRGLGALGNPEAVNVRTRNGGMWVADQLVVDALSDDMRSAWEGMSPAMKKIEKKLKRIDDPARANEINQNFAFAYEMKDRDQAAKIFAELGLDNNDIARLNDAHTHMFGPEGFLVRMADMMADTGKMSRKAAEKFKRNPRMPRAMRKSMMSEANMVEVRDALRDVVRTNLQRSSVGTRADVADMYGLFMNKSNTGMARIAEFDAMDEEMRGFFLKVARAIPEEQRGADFSSMSAAERAFRGSEYFRTWMTTPQEMRVDLKVDPQIFHRRYAAAIKGNSPTAYSGVRNDAGEVVASPVKHQMQTVYNKRVKAGDAFDTDDALTALAHLDMIQLKQGGQLGDFRFIGDPDYAMSMKPELVKYMDYQVNHSVTRLLGSNAPRIYGAAAQQHALGIKGANTFDVIDNLRFRAEQGMHIEGVEMEDVARFLQELDVVDDQLRSLWGMRPRHTEEADDFARNFMSVSRIGVSTVSAGNFTLSALAETLASSARSIGRMLTGDFAVITDYLRGLSKAQREHLLRQANGWETTKIEMGMSSRMGDLGYDALDDYMGREVGSKTFTDKLEDASRGVQRFAMTGFKSATEFSRASVISQAIRHVGKTASRNGYGRLADLVEGLDITDLKQVRGLARQAGVDTGTVVSLYQNGMLTPTLLRKMQSVLSDKNMFDNVYGLKQDNFWAANPGDVQLKSAITHLIQFENNKVNLDPRFGNKLVPKNIVQSLIATLGQFPALFYSRLRQGAWQGGLAIGAGAFLLPMLLGEIYYSTLSEVARGEDVDEVMERWQKDPAGALSRILVRANMIGGMTPMLEYATAQAIISARRGLDNPEFMSGFGGAAFFNSPINAAGLGMGITALGKFTGGVSDLIDGDVERGTQRLAAATPLPYKQLWKIFLRKAIQETPEGQVLLDNSVRPVRGPQTASGAFRPEQRPTAPETPETPEKEFETFSDFAADRGVTQEGLDDALGG